MHVREGGGTAGAERPRGIRWPRPSGRAWLLGALVLGFVALALLGPRDPAWRPLGQDGPAAGHLQRMAEALARQDLEGARREWDRAYSAALTLGGWQGLLAVGEAYVRLGEQAGRREEGGITARGIFQIAFTRAQRERSLEGVLCTAEAFADLREQAMADLALGGGEGPRRRAALSPHPGAPGPAPGSPVLASARGRTH